MGGKKEKKPTVDDKRQVDFFFVICSYLKSEFV